MNRYLVAGNVAAIALVIGYGLIEYGAPAVASRVWRSEYKELMFKCDQVMREHFIAKRDVEVNPSDQAVKNMEATEVGLLDCHAYDKMRKRMLAWGLSRISFRRLGWKPSKRKSMNSGISSTRTKFAISASIAAGALFLAAGAASTTFEDIIREAARKNGFVPAEQTYPSINSELLAPGKTLFESKALSLNGNIACQTCHLDEFGSADGIPNAVAVGGDGKGAERVMGGGGILPRNTLAFWGRGGKGFNVFFWDGKVDFSGETKATQFGEAVPSDDPLVTAAHLPVVEIREMLAEDKTVLSNKTESVEGAENLYAAIMDHLRKNEPDAMAALSKSFALQTADLRYQHVAASLAAFIRDRFRLRETRFHRFVFEGESLSDEELRGAQLFYGKGKCANCHSGAYLSDFRFHAVPLPQIGFGKNGFGVDYGRFNVTHNPDDLYKFRTPPLFNVEKTAPYGHSGSVATMREAIIFHFDPLRGIDLSKMSALDRHEYFKRLAASADSTILSGYLDDQEVDALVAFLKTLNFDISSGS